MVSPPRSRQHKEVDDLMSYKLRNDAKSTGFFVVLLCLASGSELKANLVRLEGRLRQQLTSRPGWQDGDEAAKHSATVPVATWSPGGGAEAPGAAEVGGFRY